MSYNIEEIEGIGAVYAAKLRNSDVNTIESLLVKGSTKSGRSSLAKDTGIDESLILKWVNHADLMRIKGIGPEFSELLEAAGVDTVKEFRTRKAESLHFRMVEVNDAKKLVRRIPSVEQLSQMIEMAKNIDAKVTY